MKEKITRVLITAYAVNPYKGSEDGTGWNMINEIAKHNYVIAITRKNNREAIEKYFKENPFEQNEQLTFKYFDLPYWMRFWKKGGRGALLYYYLWQIGIVFFILKEKFKVDLVHQLNFHNDWTPSFLWLVGKPFLWGPIGHHPAIPKAYLKRSADQKAFLLDRLKWFTKKCFWSFDPFLKITKSKARRIFTINSSVKEVLDFSSEKEVRLPAVACKPTIFFAEPNPHAEFNILSIGRFVPLKGFDIAIEAFGKFYHRLSKEEKFRVKFTLLGKGPQRSALKALVKKYELESAVKFIDWVPRAEVDYYFHTASVFLFPSHEGAGMVVPEAMSFGVPILCYDNIGPGEFINPDCGVKIPYSNPEQSIEDYAQSLERLFQDHQYRQELSYGARKHFETNFTWAKKGKIISRAYLEVLYPDQYHSEAKEEVTPELSVN